MNASISDTWLMASPIELLPQLNPHAISAAFRIYPDTHIEQHEALRSPIAFAVLAVVGVRTLALWVRAWNPPELKLPKQAGKMPRLHDRPPEYGRSDKCGTTVVRC